MTPEAAERVRLAFAELADAVVVALAEAPSVTDAPDRLLGVDEAATMLGIGRTAGWELVARGELGSLKVGRRRLVPASTVADFIAARSAE